ncbi:MAG: F0F1 ATP synthase subunit B [Calditrichaeota bacterium]|nr:F0F1 ATP synthase subunit B [Calditrichota bacterium]
MMDIHPGLMIWTIISFVILLAILKKFAWGPILKALDERELGIKTNIEQARAAREEADKALAEYKRKLAEAQAEAQAVVSKSRADAERVREDLLAKSKEEAQGLVERARRQIEMETQAALNSIRAEVADLAVNVASKAIGKSLTPDVHSRLVAESLAESRN